MKNPFAYKPKSQTETKDAIQDGELVKVLVLGIDYPTKYLKELDEFNKQEELISSSMGLDYVPKAPSYKEGGIQVNYAVIARGNDGKLTEKVFKENKDGLIEPRYTCYGSLVQHPVAELAAKGWDFERRGGGDRLNKAGKPSIIDLMPKMTPEKDWKTGVVGNEIPIGQEEHYIDLINKEKERQIDVDIFIEALHGIDEEEAIDGYMSFLSKRFLICSVEGDDITYIPPLTGVMFVAKVQKVKDKYLNLIAFEYNKATQAFLVYSKLNSSWPTEDSIAYADEIIKLKEENIEKRKASKEDKRIKPTETEDVCNDSDDEEPF